MAKTGTNSGTAATPKKMLGRVATIGLDDAADGILADAFRQFNIQTVPISADPVARLQTEKFDACALHLDDNAAPILEAARKSRSNWRMVVYGISETAQQALKFSKYSVNAIIHAPIERQNTLKVVRATHLLVIHEFRRYVRVPIVTDVAIKGDSGETHGTSLEISGGGMSITGGKGLKTGTNVTVIFDLPRMAQVNVRGVVCWVRSSDGAIGVRFDNTDDARFHVRKWIDEFVENS